MLFKMLGGFLFVRLVSWMIFAMIPVKKRQSYTFMVFFATGALLVAAEFAVRWPLGVFALSQTIALVPGLLIWLTFDLQFCSLENKRN